jgi:hypothetical protein
VAKIDVLAVYGYMSVVSSGAYRDDDAFLPQLFRRGPGQAGPQEKAVNTRGKAAVSHEHAHWTQNSRITPCEI